MEEYLQSQTQSNRSSLEEEEEAQKLRKEKLEDLRDRA